MATEAMKAILEKIRAYDRIFLFRHNRMDGDCVGATKGLQRLIQLTWPEKDVRILDWQKSDYLAFLGEDCCEASDDEYQDALGIVIDTASPERVSNQKYTLCKEIIKLDHHIDREPFGDVSWVEEERSSACEMIAAFYEAFLDELKIDRQAATYIYTGMVTDSGRFQYEGVTGDTMRLAGLMLDQGIDTASLYAHLYLKEFGSLKFKAHVFQHMQITENGVAYIVIDKATQEQFALSFEEASTAISFLDGIKGCLCWLAFIEAETPDGAKNIRVRLRSRFMTINQVAEKYRGGGHANASGATLLQPEEIELLLADADAAVKEYKETHEGWL